MARLKNIFDKEQSGPACNQRLVSVINTLNPPVELCLALIAAGAPLNQRDLNGNTPLHQCAYNGNLELAAALLKAGAQPHLKNSQSKTSRDVAAEFSRRDLVALFDTAPEIYAATLKERKNKTTAARREKFDSLAHRGVDRVLKTPPVPAFTKIPFTGGHCA